MITSYKDIHGWLDFETLYFEVVKEAPLDKESHFLEIGCWMGKSACFAGQLIKESNKPITFWTVDTFKGGVNEDFFKDVVEQNGGTIKYLVQNNINCLQLQNIVKPIESLSTTFLPQVPIKKFDFIFIDGSHEYQDVSEDLNYCWPLLKKGGRFCGHDINLFDVEKAVDEFSKGAYNKIDNNCWEITNNRCNNLYVNSN